MSRRKKKGIFLTIAIILVVFIGGISTAVYSSTESKVVIRLDDSKVWQCKEEFNSEWYVNTSKKTTFQVDLSKYLKSEKDEKLNLEEPFTVKVNSINAADNSSIEITDECKPEILKLSDKPGVFEVNLDAKSDLIDGSYVEVEVDFAKENKWDIEAQTDKFNLKVDNTNPKVNMENLSEIKDKELIDTVGINCNFIESNLDKIKVTGTIIKYDGAEPETINDEFLGEKGDTIGEYSSLVFHSDDKFTLNFNTIGVYDIKVTLYDKAGNEYSTESVKFQRTYSDFKFSINNTIQNGESYYISGHNINVTLDRGYWECFEKMSVSYSVKKENSTEKPKTGTITSRNGDISVSEDGVYDVDLVVIRWSIFSGTSQQNLSYKVIFDTKEPELSIKSSGNDIEFNNNEVYFKDGQNIEVSLTDENINEDSRSINVYKEGNLIQSSKDDLVNFDALEEGCYTVEARAEDYAENEVNRTYKIYIDEHDPEINLQGVYDGAKFKKGENETPTAVIKVSDTNFKNAEAVITRKSKDEELQTQNIVLNNDETFEYLVDKDGTYTINVTAEDKAGRKNNIDTIKFERDASAPELAVKVDDKELNDDEFNEDNMPYIKNENGIKIDASVKEDYPKLNNDGTVDEKATYIKVKRTPVNQDGREEAVEEGIEEYFTENKQLTLTKDGKYEVTIYSVDNCGNESERTLFFVLDGISPDLTVTGVKDFYDGMPDIQIESKDAFQKDGYISITYVKTIKHLDGNDEVFPEETKYIDIDSSDKVINLSDLDEFKQEAQYKILSIKAIDKVGNESEKKDVEYTVDTEAPTKSIDGLEDGKLYYNSDRTININTEDVNLDNAKVTIFKNGEVYEPKAEETIQDFTIEERKAYASYNFADDGEYKVVLESTDKAGNGAREEKEFIIDKTLPDISIDDFDSLNGTYINYDRTLTVRINEKYLERDINLTYVNIVKKYPDGTVDNKNYEFNLNGQCPNYLNIYNEFTEDAEYTVTVTAQDMAGNVSVSPSLTFTVDKTVPIQSITGVENDAYYNVDKDVELLSTDVNQNINTAVVTRDGEPYNIGEFTVEGMKAVLDYIFSGEGTYEIVFTTTDKAGNTAVSTIKFTIDKTAPQIKAIKGDDGSELKFGEYINRIFTPQFLLDNSEDFITQVTLNGADITGNVSMASQEMEYNYTVTAQDKAGNVTTIDSMFTVDTTNPAITISGIMSGFFNEDLTPEFDITDTNLDYANTSSTLNGEPFTSGTTIDTQNDFNLKLIGTDLATNSNSQSISFTIDKDGPVISFKNPISGKYFTEDFIPEFIIEDLSDYTIIALTLDGEEYNIGDPIEEEGKHVLYIEVMDKAGNTSELSVEFILDKTAPKFIIDGVEDGETYYDATSATVMLDNPLDTINSITVNGEAADGEVSDEFGQQVVKLNFNDINDYEIILKGTDEAGNSTVQTVNFAVAEKTLLSKVTTNKKLLYTSLAAIISVVTMGAAAFVVKIRKLKSASVENSEDDK